MHRHWAASQVHDGILAFVTSPLPLALLTTPGQVRLKKTWLYDKNFPMSELGRILETSRPLSPDRHRREAWRVEAKLPGPHCCPRYRLDA